MSQAGTAHLEEVRRIHNDDLRQGFGRAVLPNAPAAKFSNADRSWPLPPRQAPGVAGAAKR
jgi:hypothetical protein